MTLVMACLLVTIVVFGCICLHLSSRIDDERIKREIQNITIDYLMKRVDVNKESIELQTKCIRDLNSIVKRTVKDQETVEPDTKALVSGWDADETEPEDPVKKHIVDIMLNGTYEQKQDLIDAWTLQSALLSQAQQCNYQTLQSDLLSQTQQCIYPWQPLQAGQLQSCAMLPLWYINSRLGEGVNYDKS